MSLEDDLRAAVDDLVETWTEPGEPPTPEEVASMLRAGPSRDGLRTLAYRMLMELRVRREETRDRRNGLRLLRGDK